MAWKSSKLIRVLDLNYCWEVLYFLILPSLNRLRVTWKSSCAHLFFLRRDFTWLLIYQFLLNTTGFWNFNLSLFAPFSSCSSHPPLHWYLPLSISFYCHSSDLTSTRHRILIILNHLRRETKKQLFKYNTWRILSHYKIRLWISFKLWVSMFYIHRSAQLEPRQALCVNSCKEICNRRDKASQSGEEGVEWI